MWGVWGWCGVGVEKWKLKLTSAKVEVEVEAELGNMRILLNKLKIYFRFRLIVQLNQFL